MLSRNLARTALTVAIASVAVVASQDRPEPGWATYRDPQGRFSFRYPEAFGTPGPGTNDGFGDRVAAIRFPDLRGLGGEAVLTKGPVLVDVQALGGLYDSIALEVVPDAVRAEIEKGRPVVTSATFCQLLGDADHVGAAPGLPPALAEAARRLDRMRNVDPTVIHCEVQDRVAVFHKEAMFEDGTTSTRQHIFGAVRFLDPPYSAFHIVRARPTAPTPADIEVLERIVRTLKLGPAEAGPSGAAGGTSTQGVPVVTAPRVAPPPRGSS